MENQQNGCGGPRLPMTDLSSVDRIRMHRSQARADVSRRMAKLNAAYVGSDLDARLNYEIDLILDGILEREDAALSGGTAAVGRNAEGRGFALLGESGFGKTRALRRTFVKRPEFAGFGTPECLLVSVTTPSPCTPRLLAETVLAASGYVPTRRLRENEAWDLVRHHLKIADIRIVHIDELQHVVQTGDERVIQKVRDSLKDLMAPGSGVSIIASGLPGCETLIDDDTQIDRRCRVIRLEKLKLSTDLDHVRETVIAFATLGEIACDEVVADEFLARLCHAAQYAFGILVEYVQDAVRVALQSASSALAPQHFAAVYVARTGSRSDNVFLMSAGWNAIDVARAKPFLEPTLPADRTSVPKNWRNA